MSLKNNFNWHEVEEDDSFTDPAIQNVITKQAGAAIMQDVGLNTYWANTVGKTYYPGVHDLYKEELKENLSQLMRSKMCYRDLEEFLTVLGYESGDIRDCFKSMTGMDPVKLEYMRLEDVKSTPPNIPAYNLGWGESKDSKFETYFVMPYQSSMFSLYGQVDDMTREECGIYLNYDEAKEQLKELVTYCHIYDQPAHEAVMQLSDVSAESGSKHYVVLSNYLYSQQKRGDLDPQRATKLIADSVESGTLSVVEGESLIGIYCTSDKGDPLPEVPRDEGDTPSDLKYHQKVPRVKDELNQVTPDQFFKSVLPERVENIAPEHVRGVMDFVATRNREMDEFDLKLHSFEYLRHDTPRSSIEPNAYSGRPEGPPKATVSVILEIEDKTVSGAAGRKFSLAVFFITPDGGVRTSDSLKGEDDLMYGFSEEGLKQYFNKERLTESPE